MAIKIDKSALENACKEIIQTILLCLPNAYKGTVYRIGGPPEMIATRITSGKIDPETKIVSWGLPEKSDYNPPGKPWLEYRDEPGRPLEAMAWCVEKQKSWTAENPSDDIRGVRAQGEYTWSDSHHMEPVLIRKEDLYPNGKSYPSYPENYDGEELWRGMDHVVVAVTKTHFRPNTIKIGGVETKVIKSLSRTLGTELLSYHLKQQSIQAMREVAEDRLNACNMLAHALRNALSKSGLVFSLMKLELASLRAEWEKFLLRYSEKGSIKSDAVHELEGILDQLNEIPVDSKEDIVNSQKRFLEISLPPEKGKKWIQMQIENKWKALSAYPGIDGNLSKKINSHITRLKDSLYLGADSELLEACDVLPEDLKSEVVGLLYGSSEDLDMNTIERLIQLLDNPLLALNGRERAQKKLIYLKTLAKVMDELEDNTNNVLQQVMDRCDENMIKNIFNSRG